MSAFLHCAVTSTAPPTIEWWLTPTGSQQPQLVANQTYTQSNSYSIEATNNSVTLIIGHAKFPQNHGVYTCRALVDGAIDIASADVNVLCKYAGLISYENNYD